MNTFRIGELCVLQNSCDPRNNGREVVIVEGLEKRGTYRLSNPNQIWIRPVYVVKTSNGQIGAASPYQLRRKSPPASTADEREYADLMDRLMNRKEQTACHL